MKILLGCLNANNLGGSEMYHYELAREFHLAGHDITLFTIRPIDKEDQVRQKLYQLGVKQVDKTTIDINEKFDIIAASQTFTCEFMAEHFNNIPIVSIIHSEVRFEHALIHPKISNFIAIRKSIKDYLCSDTCQVVENYAVRNGKLMPDQITLIYNPIDRDRFNTNDIVKFEKTTGIFIGEVNDPIRINMVNHIVNECIKNDWDLLIMSNSRYNFNNPNIKFIDRRWDTETIVKKCHFTVGILLGRTTLEGLHCDVPGYIYNIDEYGNILSITSDVPDNIIQLTDSKYVMEQHIKLYEQIIENFKAN